MVCQENMRSSFYSIDFLVLGESGLGKATLINSLFLTDLYPERHIPSAQGLTFFLPIVSFSIRHFYQ